jgi:ubiquinone/menaquinone biosynthesis C-methylase UbiE
MSRTERINAPRIRYIVSRVEGKTLDAGCVGGDWRFCHASPLSSLHQRIKQICQDVIGLDLNIEGLRKMKHLDPETSLVRADACCLPFRNGSFDTVVAGEIIEHISNVGFFLDEVYRVLRQNGTLLGDTPNACDLKCIVDLLRGKKQTITQGTTHVHVLDEHSLRLLLLQHGFQAEISYSQIESRRHIWKVLKVLEKKIYPTTTHWLSYMATKISKQREKAFCQIE